MVMYRYLRQTAGLETRLPISSSVWLLMHGVHPAFGEVVQLGRQSLRPGALVRGWAGQHHHVARHRRAIVLQHRHLQVASGCERHERAPRFQHPLLVAGVASSQVGQQSPPGAERGEPRGPRRLLLQLGQQVAGGEEVHKEPREAALHRRARSKGVAAGHHQGPCWSLFELCDAEMRTGDLDDLLVVLPRFHVAVWPVFVCQHRCGASSEPQEPKGALARQ
mmetsp:Transcript_36923/g.80437  ORF Transcript_36923/g.80437 Transcript_36923/m.80437 type:complete len:221 (+) Transcript_36923:134-796(+)